MARSGRSTPSAKHADEGAARPRGVTPTVGAVRPAKASAAPANPRRQEAADAQYEVGYGKPPRSSQFKKGQSGNPRGRPKNSRSLTTIIQALFDSKMVVRENGRERRLTKREVLGIRLENDALGGNYKALPVLITHDRQDDGLDNAHRTLSPTDLEFLARHLGVPLSSKEGGVE